MSGADLGLASSLFQEGRLAEARAALQPVLDRGGADARQLMGLILHRLGDVAGCERELRQAVSLAPSNGAFVQALTRFLLSEGREPEAVEIQTAYEAAATSDPHASYLLAATLYNAGRETEAEAACRRAIAKGLDQVEPWTFLARLQNLQGRLEEAETSYRRAVAHDPLAVEPQRELAQLIWMRTADVAQARAVLDAAPPTASLTAVSVKLLQDADEHAAAFALACERADRDPSLNVLAARAGLRVDPEAADRRMTLAPPWVNALARAKGEIEIDLALGRGADAARRAEALSAAHPEDHYVTALKAAAWRLVGDVRVKGLYDYNRLVRSYEVGPPPGWGILETWLAALERVLDGIHGDLTHPLGQSVRHGSQTMRSLLDYPQPEIRGFFEAIDAPIRAHIAAIGATGGYAVAGAWSVRLRRQGFHTNHVHPEGWLSSAFYVRTPDAPGHEGWIKFGEPGTPTRPPLGPEFRIRPEPGMLVLFPSYMWHGVEPFSSDSTRLTCAFDVVKNAE